MKHVEAVMVSWQSAAGRRYCQWCLALASGAGLHEDGALSLRFICARLSLGDSDWRGLMLGTKRVEAVIVSWQLAAGRRYCQWCLALASGAGLHGDGALSLLFNCARLSLDTIQV